MVGTLRVQANEYSSAGSSSFCVQLCVCFVCLVCATLLTVTTCILQSRCSKRPRRKREQAIPLYTGDRKANVTAAMQA